MARGGGRGRGVNVAAPQAEAERSASSIGREPTDISQRSAGNVQGGIGELPNVGHTHQQDEPTTRELLQAFMHSYSHGGLTEFLKLAKSFDGRGVDPSTVEEWIEHIEKVFDA